MSKYRVKHFDSTLLFLTPFVFLNMCDNLDHWNIKKH